MRGGVGEKGKFLDCDVGGMEKREGGRRKECWGRRVVDGSVVEEISVV